MPAPRTSYTPEEIVWQETTRTRLRTAGASETVTQAYERIGWPKDVTGPNTTTRVYLDPRAKAVLVGHDRMTVEEALNRVDASWVV
jgi:hypothetical protein